MSSGFWAGAVPPWAWVVGGCLGVLLVMLGVWAGYGRGQKHAEEDEALEREQFGPRIGLVRDRRLLERAWARLPEPEDAWLAHEDQALTIANGPMWEYRAETPTLVGQVVHAPAITTGEIQAITDEMDTWLAVHVYGAPKDYGEWLEREDR